MKYIDVSLPIFPGMLAWPSQDWINLEAIEKFETEGVRVSRLTLGTHTGTHIDAPWHFLKDGYGVDQIPLEKLIGPCVVIEVDKKYNTIDEEFLKKQKLEKKILFKTRGSTHLTETEFYAEFVYLTEGAAEYLVEQKVELVGIDYMSIEKRGSPGHPVHTALLRAGVVILETLNLSECAAGMYTIHALPLKLQGGDGAPARVILSH